MEAPNADASWKNWFRHHGPRLLLCARQWTRSAADAEDVVQEAFVRFWRQQRHLPGDPFALLLTSVRRAALDQARQLDRRAAREARAHAGVEPGSEPWFDPPVLADDGRTAELEAALRQLPAEQREVLVLKLWGELTFEAIATQLAIPPATAASRYRYALGALRKLLNPATACAHG